MSDAAAPVAVSSEQPLKVSAEQLGIVTGDEYDGQLEYDLGNLTAYDPAPIDHAKFETDLEETLKDAARAATQALVNKLFSLPSEAVTGGRLAALPPPSTLLPRAKIIPKAKPLTKWAKFAQTKGITKRKRSKLEFDDAAGEWRRRHGYKKLNDDNEVAVLDARMSDKVGDDPFLALKNERKERVKQQGKRQLGNVKDAMKSGGVSALPVTLRLAATLPTDGESAGSGRGLKRKGLKDEIKQASRQAGVSTASLGKFDRRLRGEKDGERAPIGKRRKFSSVTDVVGEKAKLTSFADRFLRERADDIVDVKKAIGKYENDAEAGKSIAGGASRGKGRGKNRGRGGEAGTGRGGMERERGQRDKNGEGGKKFGGKARGGGSSSSSRGGSRGGRGGGRGDRGERGESSGAGEGEGVGAAGVEAAGAGVAAGAEVDLLCCSLRDSAVAGCLPHSCVVWLGVTCARRLAVSPWDRRVREDVLWSGISEAKTGVRLGPMSGLLWDLARTLRGSALALVRKCMRFGHAMILRSTAPATMETCSTLQSGDLGV
ncbi:MAG: hypothetical protein WDW36_000766 [Sanguina aurantia]